MENRLIVFGQAPAELVEVADAHVEKASEAIIVSVARKSGSSYVVQGNLNMTDYAKEAIVKNTGINKGDRTNAVFSINIPEDELDDASKTALDDYIAKIKDLYEYMVQVEEGEIEDTRFDGKFSFDDFFVLNDDDTIRNVVLRAGVGFGFPTFELSGWGAFEIEFREDVTNPYHKVFAVELGEDTEIVISSNNGGTRVGRGNTKSLVEKYGKSKPKASASTGVGRRPRKGAKEEIPYAEDDKEETEDAPKGRPDRRLRSSRR
jgi:hypothetical protein